MRTLRIAAFITIIGGLVASVRFAQALALEMAFDGPPDLKLSPAGLNAATMGGVKCSHPEWVVWS
jgi:hypothetical protein